MDPAVDKRGLDRSRLLRALSENASAVMLGAGMLVAVAVCSRTVLASLEGVSFQTDAWEIISDGRTWRDFFASEWRHMFDGRDRFRPTTHLVFDLWVRAFGFDAVGLGRALWGLVIALHVAEAIYLRKIGFKVETALLASFVALFSAASVGTTYAHQYNDLILGALFMFAALNLCLRPTPQPVWRVVALAVLGFGAHESAVLVGPVLVLSRAFASGLGSWRTWTARWDARAVVIASVAYSAVRFAGGASRQSGLFGPSNFVRNNVWLLERIKEEMLQLPRPFLVPLALLALWKVRDLRKAAALLAFTAAWVIVTYSPFAMNRLYGSITYVGVALLVPTAMFLEWIMGELLGDGMLTGRPEAPGGDPMARRPAALRGLASLVILALLVPTTLQIKLSFSDRLGGPVIRAIVERAAATPPREPMDVWIFESQLGANVWHRSQIEDELQTRSTHESVALRQLIPGRTIRVQVVNLGAASSVHPRPSDMILLVVGRPNHRYWIWALPREPGPPRLIFGRRDPHDPEPPPQPPPLPFAR